MPLSMIINIPRLFITKKKFTNNFTLMQCKYIKLIVSDMIVLIVYDHL